RIFTFFAQVTDLGVCRDCRLVGYGEMAAALMAPACQPLDLVDDVPDGKCTVRITEPPLNPKNVTVHRSEGLWWYDHLKVVVLWSSYGLKM
ncbi:MAG: hypothetical protein ACRDCQ_06675, partial [Aeromonas sobria]